MKQIAFVEKNKTEIIDIEKKEPDYDEICVEMLYTAISAGTERANLTGDPNVCGDGNTLNWPRVVGYSGSGIISSVGKNVSDLKVGDKVITYWGKHQQFNTLPRKNVVKIENDCIKMSEAAFVFISTFSLAAIRKCRIELGESCMVFGLGLLGLFSIQYAHLSGAYPVIAVDFSKERRELALKLGADFAFDPSDADFHNKVMSVTESKGANAIIEVTGNPAALNTALDNAAKGARVALLGCTRVETTVDFYHKVHFPGVELIGAHTAARPELESRPGCWTHYDDCKAALKMLSCGMLNIKDMISEIHPYTEAKEVFNRLAFDKNFPIGVALLWK